MILKLYRFLWGSLLPFIKLFMKGRVYIGKEDKIRVGEKFGIAGVSRPNGRVIWIHAASVGESLSAVTFIKYFQKNVSDDFTFLLTTGTVSSAKIICDKKLNKCIHQFVPLDYCKYIERFLEHWKPSYVFFVESEIWPTIITSVKCPLFLINARLTDRSFKRWNLARKTFSELLNKFTRIYAQSENDRNKLESFSLTNVLCTGNIKYSSEKLHIDDELLSIFLSKEHRPSFVAASTHPNEESLVLQSFKLIKDKFDSAILYLVPRHPQRACEVCKLIEKFGYKYVLRSKIDFQKLPSDCNVVCVDSFGELGTFFELADLVFLGGSLVDIGGHNICEPIASKRPVAFGRYMYNFEEMKTYFMKLGVAFETKTPQEISDLFIAITEDKNKVAKIKERFELIAKKNPVELVCNDLCKLFR